MLKVINCCCLLLLLGSISASTSHNTAMLLFYSSSSDSSKSTLPPSQSLLWRAALSGSLLAEERIIKHAKEYNQHYWIKKVADLGNLSAIKFLAQQSSDQIERTKWLLKAAKQQDEASLFELSLLTTNKRQRIAYLHEAANLNYAPAIIALAKFYYANKDMQEATDWLRKAATYDAQSQYRLGRLLWQQNKREEALKAFVEASEAYADASEYAKTIQEIRQVKLDTLIPSLNNNMLPSDNGRVCEQRLQFAATSLDSAVHARQFKQYFEKDERFTHLSICILPIVWLEDNALACQPDNARQRCDLWPLAKIRHKPLYSHLVLFLPSGKAYVQNGLMHLDQADVYSVFVHELAHFAGFVDEYAISDYLAEQYCSGMFEAPNLLVYTQKSGLSRQENQANLQGLATDKWGGVASLSASRTCANSDVQSYKPSADITFLEHHDTDNIPPLYLLFWQNQLEKKSVTIGEYFARLAAEKNDPDLSRYWRNINL
ncbi:tetratricopeptide repeat protein [Glaciecola petra]|uniref:Sel1 repeat family protein n=1 Tax=Glaciecola petra TaxID=3075602 RepID=A0ABU2ZPE9_9ALTE|nr:hypothetical protein [Aestuariibacter sp. P117]MDT0594496.1 hypothetical protein [Aestuariibacter sp. P117]